MEDLERRVREERERVSALMEIFSDIEKLCQSIDDMNKNNNGEKS